MAEICINCNKKIGFWDVPAFYVGDNKPVCDQCYSHVAECFEKLNDCTVEDLSRLEDELLKICQEKYNSETIDLVIKEFKDRKEQRGLLTKEEIEERDRQKSEFEEKVANLLMTTTNNFEGYKSEKYVQVVSEEIVFKNSFMKRWEAGLEDLGNAFSFKQTEMSGASELIANAREYILDKYKRKVVKLGANAVVGVDFESSFGSDIVRVAIFGTAVIISK